MMYCISYAHEELREQAEVLAARYSLTLAAQVLPRLHLTTSGLELLDSQGSPITMDWNRLVLQQRNDLLKATLAHKKLTIYDITAGWGRDALVMANAGSSVVMVEKNPLMAAMLEDCLARLDNQQLRSRISLVWSCAKQFLETLSLPAVIYLDPMHPKRVKTALVKKHLHTLQSFIPPNDDVIELIALAMLKQPQRLVLKWPAKQSPPLRPNFSYHGKTIDYHIYL